MHGISQARILDGVHALFYFYAFTIIDHFFLSVGKFIHGRVIAVSEQQALGISKDLTDSIMLWVESPWAEELSRFISQ